MDFTPFPIYDMKYGKVTAKKPWLLPQDAFKDMLNAYVERGVLKKRKGYTEWGRFVHAVTDEVIGTGDETDIIENGGFDSDTTGWAAVGGTCSLASVASGESGNCLQMTRVGGTSQMAANTPLTLVLGGTYLITFWVKSGTSGNEAYRFYCTGDETELTTLASGTTSGTWTEVQAAIVATAYHVANGFQLFPCKYSSTAGTMLFDSISMVQVIRTFVKTLDHNPLQDIIEVTDGVETFSDDGDGTLTGDAGGWGSYNKAAGVISVTFAAAPADGEDILCSYHYHPGNSTQGIWEHYTAGGRYLVAFDTKRMCKYNTSTSLLEDKALADTWTGSDDDFFHCCSATDDKLYITNGVDQIRTWTGSTLAAFVADYAGGSSNKITTCKFIFEYHGHIVLLAPTEEGAFKPRRCRSSAPGTYTSWPSYGWVDAPTPDEIMGAQMIANVLFVWFKESLWRLNYTGVTTKPFEWERVSQEEGLYASFSTLTIGGKSYGIGKSAIIATDGVTVAPVDTAIPDSIISDYDVAQVKYAYAARIRDLRQIWWSLCYVGSTYPDRVLAYDYENGQFFPYDLSFQCFGSYTAGSTLTLDDIEEAWDDIEYTWDSASAVAGYPMKLAGTHDGYIMQTNDGYSDNGSAIEFLLETGEWNPYILKGMTAMLGWVDFLVTTNEDTELTIDFYGDQDPDAYLSRTLDFADDDSRDRTMVWKRVYVGAVGSHHKMRIYHTASGQPVEIHAVVPYFKADGPIL